MGALFGGDVDAIDLGPELGRASRLKMAFAHYQKGSRALAAASHALARRATGLTEHLLRRRGGSRWPRSPARRSWPRWPAKAWRWGPEMLEIAATMEAAGLPGEPARGAAAAFARWDGDKDTDLPLDEVLRHLRA